MVKSGVGGGRVGAGTRMLIEYLPFVTLLLALYTAGGGVLVRGGPVGTPPAIPRCWRSAWCCGPVMGTTGAAMVLIHPLLHANAHRRARCTSSSS